MADRGQTSFSFSTHGVDHSSSSSSSDIMECVVDPRLEEIAIVYTTKLDDMDVFNRSLDNHDLSLNDITNCIARESKPVFKNIVKHSSRTEHTTSYDRVLKKIQEFNEKCSFKVVNQNDSKCLSLSHDSHTNNKKETSTDKLRNNNKYEDNIHETNTHETVSKTHTIDFNDTNLEKNIDIGNDTVKYPSSYIIELSGDEDVLILNDDEMLKKSFGTKSRKIATKKRKQKDNRRKVKQNFNDIPTVLIIDNDDDKDESDDDEPLVKIKYKKQIFGTIQECKQPSIVLEDIGFRKRTLRTKPHNGTGFLYCGEWLTLSKISRADLKRKIRNVYLFFHDKCTQMIDIYVIEDGHMAEHMKVNSKRNTVILKNNLNSKQTIEIECYCWYEREQANLKALELGILTTNNVMFMKQSHNCEKRRCVCCCSTQICRENLEIQSPREASRIDFFSVTKHNDWNHSLKSEDEMQKNAACLINQCLTYDRFMENSSKYAISTLDSEKSSQDSTTNTKDANSNKKKHETFSSMEVGKQNKTPHLCHLGTCKFRCSQELKMPLPKSSFSETKRSKHASACSGPSGPEMRFSKYVESLKKSIREKKCVPAKPLKSAINIKDRPSVKSRILSRANKHIKESENPSNIADSPELATASGSLPTTQNVKNVAELMASLITKMLSTPTTKSSELESGTITVTETEQNKELVSSRTTDNSSSVSQSDDISIEKDDLDVNSLITKFISTPTTKSSEQESGTIKETEQNKEFVSSRTNDNSSGVSQSDDISTEKDDLGVDSLITTILERFQGVRLTINEKGKVAVSLSTPINTLSSTEIEVLSKILARAQQHVDALGLVPGTNLGYFNKCGCTLGQNTGHLQSCNHNPVLVDKSLPPCQVNLNTSYDVLCTSRDVVSVEADHNKLNSDKYRTLEQITDDCHQSSNQSQDLMDEIILSDDDNLSTSRDFMVSREANISNDFYKTFSKIENNRCENYRQSLMAFICKVPVNLHTTDNECPTSRDFVPFVTDKNTSESDLITNRHKTSNDTPVMMDKAILSYRDNVLALDNPSCTSRDLTPIETDKSSNIYKKFAIIVKKRNQCYKKSLVAFQSKKSSSTTYSPSNNTKNAHVTAQREVSSSVPPKKREAITDGSSKFCKKKKPSSKPDITQNQNTDNGSLAVIPIASSSTGPKISREELVPVTMDLAISDVSLDLHEEVDIKPEEIHITDVDRSDDIDNEDWVRAIKEEEEEIAQQVDIISKINFGE